MENNNDKLEPIDHVAAYAGILRNALGDIDNTPYIALPSNWKITNLSGFLNSPTRASGTVILHDIESFVAYVNAHKTAASAIYADPDDRMVMAVLNDHAPSGSPGHRDHIARCPILYSRQWQAWTAAHGLRWAHDTFAELIEDRLEDFQEPDGAAMMEIVLNLEAKKVVSFQSGVRLDTGSFSFAYEEDTRAGPRAGNIEIPSVFTIFVPVLRDAPPQAVVVRLRYRLDGKAIFFTPIIINREEIIEKAIANWLKDMDARIGAPLYLGMPVSVGE